MQKETRLKNIKFEVCANLQHDSETKTCFVFFLHPHKALIPQLEFYCQMKWEIKLAPGMHKKADKFVEESPIKDLISFRLTWLTPKLVVPSSTTSPCMFTLTRLEAVISLYIIPEGKVVSNGIFYEMKIMSWSINFFFLPNGLRRKCSVSWLTLAVTWLYMPCKQYLTPNHQERQCHEDSTNNVRSEPDSSRWCEWVDRLLQVYTVAASHPKNWK